MHNTYEYSQHSSIISPVWLNGWVFVHKLSGFCFESSNSNLNYPGNHRLWIQSETRTRDMIKADCLMHRTDKYSQHSLIIWSALLNG